MAITTSLDIINQALRLLNEATISDIDPNNLSGVERTTAQKVVPLYDVKRQELLTAHKWAFAKKAAHLEVAWMENGGTDSNTGEAELYHVNHGLVTGQRVVVKGTKLYDGHWIITKIDNNNVVLDNSVYTAAGDTGYFALAPRFGYAYQMTLPNDCLRVHTVGGVAARSAARFWRRVGKNTLEYNKEEADVWYGRDEDDVETFTPWFISSLYKLVAADAAMSLLNNNALRNQYLAEVERTDIPNAIQQNEIEKDEQPYEQAPDFGGRFRESSVEGYEVAAPEGGAL